MQVLVIFWPWLDAVSMCVAVPEPTDVNRESPQLTAMCACNCTRTKPPTLPMLAQNRTFTCLTCGVNVNKCVCIHEPRCGVRLAKLHALLTGLPSLLDPTASGQRPLWVSPAFDQQRMDNMERVLAQLRMVGILPANGQVSVGVCLCAWTAWSMCWRSCVWASCLIIFQ